jgi:hypothetical protein
VAAGWKQFEEWLLQGRDHAQAVLGVALERLPVWADVTEDEEEVPGGGTGTRPRLRRDE